MLEKILLNQPCAEVAQAHVHQAFQADIDGAIAYLSPEFAAMFTDVIVFMSGWSS